MSREARDDETLGDAAPDKRINVTELSVMTAGSDDRSRPLSTDDSNDVRLDKLVPKVGEARPAKLVEDETMGTDGTETSGGDGAPFKKEADIYDGSISKEDLSWIGEFRDMLLVSDSRGPGMGGGGGEEESGGPRGGSNSPPPPPFEHVLPADTDEADPIEDNWFESVTGTSRRRAEEGTVIVIGAALSSSSDETCNECSEGSFLIANCFP